MTPTSDEELIRRIAQQDVAAFEILHQRYEDRIRQHLRRMIPDPDSSEDLLQEAFLRIWTRAHQYPGRGPFLAWFLRVTTNLALNFLRSKRRRREQPLVIPVDSSDPDDEETFVPAWMIDRVTPGPDVAVEQGEQRRVLHDLVSRLPEGKRDAIRLVYEAGLDIRGAAAELAIPEGTVKSRLHHATRTLARKLQELDDD